jgi:hypothetical protein
MYYRATDWLTQPSLRLWISVEAKDFVLGGGGGGGGGMNGQF